MVFEGVTARYGGTAWMFLWLLWIHSNTRLPMTTKHWPNDKAVAFSPALLFQPYTATTSLCNVLTTEGNPQTLAFRLAQPESPELSLLWD